MQPHQPASRIGDEHPETSRKRTRRALLSGAGGAAGVVAVQALVGTPDARADDVIDQQAFIANGPYPAGFLTTGSNIDRGVDVSGTLEGVRGSGPTGVEGLGSSGPGVKGTGQGGPGGSFSAKELNAQLHLAPQTIRRSGVFPARTSAHPTQLARPTKALPKRGHLGDMWFMMIAANNTGNPPTDPRIALWLCVKSSTGQNPSPANAAQWREVLLGDTFTGEALPQGTL